MSTKSQELAAALVASLQEDLATGSAVASLLILPMVKRATELKHDLIALDQAQAIDAEESKGGAA